MAFYVFQNPKANQIKFLSFWYWSSQKQRLNFCVVNYMYTDDYFELFVAP